MEKKLYTVTEIHEGFGLSRGFIMQLINEKKLKALKIGSIWRVRTEDLEEYLSGCENNFDVEK